MSVVHEFVTPVPVDTRQGKGHALFVEVDNHVQYWTVVLDVTGAFVTFPQDQILAQPSYTHGRRFTHERMTEILENVRQQQQTK